MYNETDASEVITFFVTEVKFSFVLLVSDLLVLTVATEANDGYYRFMSSAEEHGLNVKVSFDNAV